MSTAEEHARGTLEDLASRRRTVVSTIRTVAAFYGLDPAAWLDDAGEPAPAETSRAPREATRASREPAPAPRETTRAPRETPARPTHALSEAAIRAALKAGHETPKAIVAATQLPTWAVGRTLAKLRAAGHVTVTGKVRSARYRLA